jgi:hypothetical protein
MGAERACADVDGPGFGIIFVVTDDEVGALGARLHLLAANLLLDKASAEEAMSLASDLLVADFTTSATIEVAALYRGTTLGEAEHLVRRMLFEQGLEVPKFSSEEERFVTFRRAFGCWNLLLSDFEGLFYERLPAWDAQDKLDQALVIMFHERDHEADPAQRAQIEIGCAKRSAPRTPKTRRRCSRANKRSSA